MLTHGELKLVVDRVNSGLALDLSRVEAVQAVGRAVAAAGRGLPEALRLPGLDLPVVLDSADEVRLQTELALLQRARGGDLWWEDLRDGLEAVLAAVWEVESLADMGRAKSAGRAGLVYCSPAQ